VALLTVTFIEMQARPYGLSTEDEQALVPGKSFKEPRPMRDLFKPNFASPIDRIITAACRDLSPEIVATA
jgi:hypothetical protein